MTESIEQRAERLLAGVTPGEWGVEDCGPEDTLSVVANPTAPTHEWVVLALAVEDAEDGLTKTQMERNAEFIAASPSLVRDLLAVNASLREENARLTNERDAAESQCASAERELNAAESALTALRARVQQTVEEMRHGATTCRGRNTYDGRVAAKAIEQWASVLADALTTEPRTDKGSRGTAMIQDAPSLHQSLAAFERRCRETPDLELSPFYWNQLLPETTGRAIVLLFMLPLLRGRVYEVSKEAGCD